MLNVERLNDEDDVDVVRVVVSARVLNLDYLFILLPETRALIAAER